MNIYTLIVHDNTGNRSVGDVCIYCFEESELTELIKFWADIKFRYETDDEYWAECFLLKNGVELPEWVAGEGQEIFSEVEKEVKLRRESYNG